MVKSQFKRYKKIGEFVRIIGKMELSPRYYHTFVTHGDMLYLIGGRYKDHSLAMSLVKKIFGLTFVDFFQEEYNLATTTFVAPTIDQILPNDCLMEIFSYFPDEKQLVTLTRVCKRFNKLASNFFSIFSQTEKNNRG